MVEMPIDAHRCPYMYLPSVEIVRVAEMNSYIYMVYVLILKQY
jgi:hypothetical protein